MVEQSHIAHSYTSEILVKQKTTHTVP